MNLPVIKSVRSAGTGLLLAIACSCFMATSNAAAGSARFEVTATLLSASSPVGKTGFCTQGSGATLVIVCSTDPAQPVVVNTSPVVIGGSAALLQWSANRYIFQNQNNVDLPANVNTYVGIGSSTSWRVVNLDDREYLEMLVGW